MDQSEEMDAAVAVVHARGPQESVLLIRRAEREDDPWSGHWSFPGGRRHAGDPDLLHAALRELEEECGIRLTRERLVAELPRRMARRRQGAPVPVTPFVFRVESELAAVPDGREAVETLWAALGYLRDPCNHRLLAIPGLPPEDPRPAIALRSAPLWGFTYKLVCDWLGVAGLR
jgi:8-oxo-dGTP pyrophosphatase MutT (NUDIX family)